VCILKARVGELAGFQTFLSGNRRAKPGALSVAAMVCLVLLTLLAVVQVAHVHPVDTDADHCLLCIAMHSAAPVAAAAAVVVLVKFERTAPVYKAHTISRYWHPQLFTRPPPDGLQG
jgi:adenosylmethionine-8-amino-7-oxononanoate aminotransferase